MIRVNPFGYMKLNWLMQWRFCSSIKLPTILRELDWIWCGGVVRIPPYEKKKMQAAELRMMLSLRRGGPTKWVTGAT